ncbi:MAG: SDR family oxidoreductase [Lachnospiraceae bacterium]|jgi:3-oxoacyl-[acyl-carrier protein] reductase|nr:SDR family oxidoreductase [Lachnospiraceae bacterium]
MLLKGKNAVITGCNRGIGKAILEKFANNGANVYAVIRTDSEELDNYIKELSEKNDVFIKKIIVDLSDEEQIKAGAKEIMSDKLPIDVLVCNAGTSNPLSSLAMTKLETIKNAFDINLFSQMLLTQLLARNMMRNKNGSIVYISSSAAFDGGANIEYSSSKAAIIGEMRRLAVEYGPFNIRVNAVAPGLTATDMGNSMSKEDEEIALSMNIMHRKGKPEEIADAVVYLGSDMSSFVTGQVLRVDGGLR